MRRRRSCQCPPLSPQHPQQQPPQLLSAGQHRRCRRRYRPFPSSPPRLRPQQLLTVAVMTHHRLSLPKTVMEQQSLECLLRWILRQRAFGELPKERPPLWPPRGAAFSFAHNLLLPLPLPLPLLLPSPRQPRRAAARLPASSHRSTHRMLMRREEDLFLLRTASAESKKKAKRFAEADVSRLLSATVAERAVTVQRRPAKCSVFPNCSVPLWALRLGRTKCVN